MKTSRRRLASSLSARARVESGFTLAEILVASIILAILAAVTITLITNFTNSADRFGKSTTTQSEITEAANTINRDISNASNVTFASGNAITLASMEGNTNYTVKIFAYSPGGSLPSGYTISNTNLPNYGAIIEQRTAAGSSTTVQNIMVPGYTPVTGSNTPLFQYFDGTNAQIGGVNASPLSSSQLNNIKRVQYFIKATLASRAAPLEIGGSSTPRSFAVQGVTNPAVPNTPGAPVLTGVLAEGDQTSTLRWNSPAGATSYTMYRQDNSGGYTLLQIVPDPTTNACTDGSTTPKNGVSYQCGTTNLTLGDTYSYYIVANGPGGTSQKSNVVTLTVVPPQVIIVNINTKKNLTDTYSSADTSTANPVANGQRYTVARGLTDQISWAYANGATGYYVYRDGASNPIAQITSGSTLYYNDTSVAYGDTHTYRVAAYNTGTNCDGNCDGAVSNPVTLISPPTAPVLTAANNGTSNRVTLTNTNMSPTSASGYELYSATGGNGGTPNCSNLNDTNSTMGGTTVGTYRDINTNYGYWSCYAIAGYNDAGYGPQSSPVSVVAGPGPFSIININSTAPINNGGTYYTVARGLTNQVVWSQAAGATSYRVYRDGNQIGTTNGSNVYDDYNVNYGDTHTYYVVAVTDFGSAGQPTAQTGTVNLVSPPTAPSISAVANDTSSDGTYSNNTINVNSFGTNGNNITIQASNDQATSNPNCNSVSTLANGTSTSYSDNQALWGDGTCYQAYSSNDAGNSPTSGTATALQLPGRFAVGTGSNDNGWFKLANSSTSGYDFQRSDVTSNTSNPNFDLNYSIGWSSSPGATGGYDTIFGYLNSNPSSSSQKESWRGNGYSVCSTTDANLLAPAIYMPQSSGANAASSTTCYKQGTSATSFSGYSDLSPGSYYRLAVIAIAPDGLRRPAANTFYTTPAEPAFVGSFIYQKATTACSLRVASVGVSTAYGTASSVSGKVNFISDTTPNDWSASSTSGNTQPTGASVNGSSSAYLGIASDPKDPNSGKNDSTGFARSYLSQGSYSGFSSYVEWNGVTPGADCTRQSSTWTGLPESSYYNNRHVWYYSENNAPSSANDPNDAPAAATSASGAQTWVNNHLN